MKNLSILPSLLIALFLASCEQNPDASLNNSGGGNTVTWTTPTIGTKYIYQIVGPLKPVTDSITILNSGQHIGGKTNVIEYQDDGGTAFDNIEPNGDISYGSYTTNSFGVSTYTWKTFPTASQQPISDPVEDTTTAQGIRTFRSDVRTFVGADSITTLAGTFATLHVRETSIFFITAPDSLSSCDASDTDDFDTWFAPSIGLHVKVTDNGTADGQVSPQSETDLVKYEPK